MYRACRSWRKLPGKGIQKDQLGPGGFQRFQVLRVIELKSRILDHPDPGTSFPTLPPFSAQGEASASNGGAWPAKA